MVRGAIESPARLGLVWNEIISPGDDLKGISNPRRVHDGYIGVNERHITTRQREARTREHVNPREPCSLWRIDHRPESTRRQSDHAAREPPRIGPVTGFASRKEDSRHRRSRQTRGTKPMAVSIRCSQGHVWESADDVTLTQGSPPRCPVCSSPSDDGASHGGGTLDTSAGEPDRPPSGSGELKPLPLRRLPALPSHFPATRYWTSWAGVAWALFSRRATSR